MPCPVEGIDCTRQDSLAVLPGWFNNELNGTVVDGVVHYNISFTAASSIEGFDSPGFVETLGPLLQCFAPTCSITVHVAAASVHVEVQVIDHNAASVAAAARLTRAQSYWCW